MAVSLATALKTKIDRKPFIGRYNLGTVIGSIADAVDLNTAGRIALASTTGDVTISGEGVSAIGEGKVLTAMIGDSQVTTNKLAANATPNAIAITAAAGAGIPVTGNGYVALAIAESAITNTLPVPTFTGQELTIFADTVGSGGSCAITVASAINATGNNVITFDAAGEMIILRGVKAGETFAWHVVVNDGASLSTSSG